MIYPFKNVHGKIPAAVVYCLDPRFRKQHNQFIEEELGFEKFDAYVFPGGPRVLLQDATREAFLDNIEKVSLGLHHVPEVILIAHRDCGAYGGSKAFATKEEERAKQETDLKIARNILKQKFFELEVKMYYLEIVGESEVEFEEVV